MASTRRFYAVAILAGLGLAGALVALIALAEPRALSVVEVRPGDGAADVPITIQITVTFSRPLEDASARAGISVAPGTEGYGRLSRVSPVCRPFPGGGPGFPGVADRPAGTAGSAHKTFVSAVLCPSGPPREAAPGGHALPTGEAPGCGRSSRRRC